MSTLDKNLLLEMFRKMEEIRRMDLKFAQLVKKGKVPGMTHFSVGEEAANVGAMLALNPDDLITSNHRGHGQAIAKGIDLNGMMAEILGKYTGTCKGKGGSMHIADLDAGNLGANGIVGGGMGIAVGRSPQSANAKYRKNRCLLLWRWCDQRRCFPRSSQHGFYLEAASHFLLHQQRLWYLCGY